jgi:dUTP pyrophosphatase
MGKEEVIRVKYKDPTMPKLEYVGGSEHSDWIDLRCNEDTTLKKGEFKLIDLGVAMKLPEGYEAHVAPRSSTFKKYHVIQTNSVAVIDNAYCGPEDWWKWPVLAIEDTIIPKGERVCQFRIMKIQPQIVFAEVSELHGGSRGGFGSTGRS